MSVKIGSGDGAVYDYAPMNASRRFALAMIGILLVGGVTACGKKRTRPGREAGGGESGFERIAERGEKLYRDNCGQCHGPEGRATRLADTGIDGGAAAQRHRQRLEAEQERFRRRHQAGVKRKGDQIMPGWKGRLSDAEIDDIITWFQTFWPRDVHERWQKANTTAGAGKS